MLKNHKINKYFIKNTIIKGGCENENIDQNIIFNIYEKCFDNILNIIDKNYHNEEEKRSMIEENEKIDKDEDMIYNSVNMFRDIFMYTLRNNNKENIDKLLKTEYKKIYSIIANNLLTDKKLLINTINSQYINSINCLSNMLCDLKNYLKSYNIVAFNANNIFEENIFPTKNVDVNKQYYINNIIK